MNSGFARRATLALGLLLLAFGLFVALLVRHVGLRHDEESQQRSARGLAQHIVTHWPEVHRAEPTAPQARQELLRMLMTVNPAIQVYLLDADGAVAHYIGEPGMVRTPQVDLDAVRAFLAGAPAPLRGTDPMGGPPRPFSAAMFPAQAGQLRPPGYLYAVLGATPAAAAPPDWRSAGWALGMGLGLGLLVTLLAGALVMGRLSVPLHRLARRMEAFQLPGSAVGTPAPGPEGRRERRAGQAGARDEVGAIGQAFDALAARVVQQAQARDEQAAAHREVMAGVAHDLRTPLTALHGHLEALEALEAPKPLDQPPAPAPPAARAQPPVGQGTGACETGARRHLAAALSQSHKLRRLTQQLFELATLQATQELPQRERFRLDELVSDTVLKFHPGPSGTSVALWPPPAEPVFLDGDLHLIGRALSNLIDNAVRHAGGSQPVRVSLQCQDGKACVLVEDGGPGLPPELAQRLDTGQPLRDPLSGRRPGAATGPAHSGRAPAAAGPASPAARAGGLGLAIAQRIALLHGGSLRSLPGATPGGTAGMAPGVGAGARLALALPQAGAGAGAGTGA